MFLRLPLTDNQMREVITGTHTIPYPEIPDFQILIFGPFTPQIEEWRGRDLSSFFRNEKLHIFILALFQKTVIGPSLKIDRP